MKNALAALLLTASLMSFSFNESFAQQSKPNQKTEKKLEIPIPFDGADKIAQAMIQSEVLKQTKVRTAKESQRLKTESDKLRLKYESAIVEQNLSKHHINLLKYYVRAVLLNQKKDAVSSEEEDELSRHYWTLMIANKSFAEGKQAAVLVTSHLIGDSVVPRKR